MTRKQPALSNKPLWATCRSKERDESVVASNSTLHRSQTISRLRRRIRSNVLLRDDDVIEMRDISNT